MDQFFAIRVFPNGRIAASIICGRIVPDHVLLRILYHLRGKHDIWYLASLRLVSRAFYRCINQVLMLDSSINNEIYCYKLRYRAGQFYIDWGWDYPYRAALEIEEESDYQAPLIPYKLPKVVQMDNPPSCLIGVSSERPDKNGELESGKELYRFGPLTRENFVMFAPGLTRPGAEEEDDDDPAKYFDPMMTEEEMDDSAEQTYEMFHGDNEFPGQFDYFPLDQVMT